MGEAFNPPAFPNAGAYGHTGDYLPEGGMTLRDWFAGQALPGVIAAFVSGNHKSRHIRFDRPVAEAIALDALDIADAMLLARRDQFTETER